MGTLTGVLLAVTGSATAHVDYVTDESEFTSVAELLAGAFGSLLNLALIGTGTVAVFAAVAAYLRFGSAIRDIEVIRRTLDSYRPYLPWMLRLSVGLPLVGAGFGRYLFSPSVPAEGRLLQVLLGFFLLFGLGTRLVAAVGLATYLLTLLGNGTPVLLASEYVAGFLAIVVVGPGQPSADMLLRRLVVTEGTIANRLRGDRLPKELLANVGIGQAAAPVVIRVFLGLNFLYLGIGQKLLQPGSALAVVTTYDLTAVVPVSPELWVVGAGVTEAVIGLAFIAGIFTRATATVSFLMLTVTLFGLPNDPVLAHVTLFGLSSALMVTGAGRLSLDARHIPALHRRLDLNEGATEEMPAD
jgi:uncharacterized membrane protein YphA (DoxX/SURF4 family)